MSIAKGNLVDQQLVNLSQSGDLQAFGLLVEKYQNRLYRLILRIIKNQSVVEDLVQESLINIDPLPTLEGTAHFIHGCIKLDSIQQEIIFMKRNVACRLIVRLKLKTQKILVQHSIYTVPKRQKLN
jgi:hypothetical protein